MRIDACSPPADDALLAWNESRRPRPCFVRDLFGRLVHRRAGFGSDPTFARDDSLVWDDGWGIQAHPWETTPTRLKTRILNLRRIASGSLRATLMELYPGDEAQRLTFPWFPVSDRDLGQARFWRIVSPLAERTRTPVSHFKKLHALGIAMIPFRGEYIEQFHVYADGVTAAGAMGDIVQNGWMLNGTVMKKAVIA